MGHPADWGALTRSRGAAGPCVSLLTGKVLKRQKPVVIAPPIAGSPKAHTRKDYADANLVGFVRKRTARLSVSNAVWAHRLITSFESGNPLTPKQRKILKGLKARIKEAEGGLKFKRP